MNLRYSALFGVFILAFFCGNAQQSIVSFGGDASSSAGSMSSSMGQFAYITYEGVNGSVSEGVQQPYEISIDSSLVQTQTVAEINCYVHPNPTDENIILSIASANGKNLVFQLYDSKGNLLMSDAVVKMSNVIPLSGYSQGIYLLKIVDGKTNFKSFKIIKSK